MSSSSDAVSGPLGPGQVAATWEKYGHTDAQPSIVNRLAHASKVKAQDFTHPLMHESTTEQALVDFDGLEDEYKAVNWNIRKKATITVCYGLMTSCSTWSTAIYGVAIPKISQEYHVSEVVAALGTSLFLFGLGIGPLIWAPISERFGRKPAVVLPFFVGAVFTFGTATAKDLQTIMITRFFAGFFSSAPMVNMGGVLADLYTPQDRAAAMAGYQLAVVGGPLVAPIVGGAIAQSSLSWRWTEYITGILMLLVVTLDSFVIDESYPNTLLVAKASRLRYKSGNWSLHAKHEEWEFSLRELAKNDLARPFQLLLTPICFAMCLYVGFVYALIYLCLMAFPIEFQGIRGWSPVVSYLPCLGVLIGCLIGAAINMSCNKFYLRRLAANNNKPVPEARLLPMMIGGVILVGGLFLFGWTSHKTSHWIGPCLGAVLVGISFITIFQGAMNYLVDTFRMYSASAVAANTAVRSILAGAFPLFTDAMFHKLGVNWACTVLGFIALAMVPIPVLFYIFGRKIRARGKWSRASIES